MCLSVHWEEDKLAPREARGLALFTPHTRGVPGAQLPCGHLRGQLERCLDSPASSPSRPISPPSLLVCPTRRSTRYAPLGEKKNHEFFLTAHFLKHEKETFHKCFLKQTTGRGSAALAGRSPHCGISQTREVRWYMGTKVPARDSPGIASGPRPPLAHSSRAWTLSPPGQEERPGRHHTHFTGRRLKPGKWRAAASVERHSYTSVSLFPILLPLGICFFNLRSWG